MKTTRDSHLLPDNIRHLQNLDYHGMVVGCMKNRSHEVQSGYWDEGSSSRVMTEEGVFKVSAWEGAPVDGAFFDPHDPDATDIVPAHASDAELWLWFVSHRYPLLTYDNKYFSLNNPFEQNSNMADGEKQERYYRHFYPRDSQKNGVPAELFVIRIEGVMDQMAIVPKATYLSNHTTSTQGGTTPFIARYLPWLQQFMVHRKDLKEAIQRWLMTARTEKCYVNPTTQVPLPGCKPSLTDMAPLSPSAESGVTSLRGITYTWGYLDSLGQNVKFSFNPIQPLLTDFILLLPDPVKIQHKGGIDHSGQLHLHDHNPFADSEVFDFFIWQPFDDQPIWYCFPRHMIPQEWRLGKKRVTATESEGFLCQGRNGLQRMIDMMRIEARAAMHESDVILMSIGPDHSGTAPARKILSTKTKFPTTCNVDKHIHETPTGQGNETPVDQGIGAPTDQGSEAPLNDTDKPVLAKPEEELYWLHDIFNKQCRDRKRLVLWALDSGHTWASHIIADVPWTEQNQKDFDADRRLPMEITSPEAPNIPCVLVRFLNLHRGAQQHTVPAHPFWMRNTDKVNVFQHSARSRECLILGSTVHPQDARSAQLHPAHLLLHSGFIDYSTNQGDSQTIAISAGHRGDKYFSNIRGNLESEPRKSIEVGSGFLLDKNLDPVQFLVGFNDGSIHRHLVDLMDRDKICIRSSLTHTLSPPILTANYRTTVREVLFAAWVFGLQRRSLLPNAEKKARSSIVTNVSRYQHGLEEGMQAAHMETDIIQKKADPSGKCNISGAMDDVDAMDVGTQRTEDKKRPKKRPKAKTAAEQRSKLQISNDIKTDEELLKIGLRRLSRKGRHAEAPKCWSLAGFLLKDYFHLAKEKNPDGTFVWNDDILNPMLRGSEKTAAKQRTMLQVSDDVKTDKELLEIGLKKLPRKRRYVEAPKCWSLRGFLLPGYHHLADEKNPDGTFVWNDDELNPMLRESVEEFRKRRDPATAGII